MKKWLAIIITSAFLLPAGAYAMNSIGPFGIYWDSDDLDEGYGAGGKLKLDLLEILGLEISGAWVTFDDADVTAVPVEVAAVLSLPFDQLVPYGGFGVGYYFFDADDGDFDDSVGWFFIAGVELWGDGDAALFGEIRWHVLEADADAALATAEKIDDDVDFDGLSINAGVLFKW